MQISKRGFARAKTCQSPVTPGFTSSRWRCSGVYRAQSSSGCGRGPTRLMSPRKTFHNCGSSSRLYLRRNLPRGDTRITGDLEERPTTLVVMTQRFLETVRSGDHRAEFVAIKWTTALAQAPRAINHGSTRPELDGHRDDQDDRPKESQKNRGQNYVHRRL